MSEVYLGPSPYISSAKLILKNGLLKRRVIERGKDGVTQINIVPTSTGVAYSYIRNGIEFSDTHVGEYKTTVLR